MSKRKNNSGRKRYFVGVALVLIFVFVIYVLLDCFPFGNTNQNAEQQSSMPNVTEQEVELVQNQKDREGYLNAAELIKEKRFSRAYKDLARLREKYKDTAFEHCIMLKMSDCLIMTELNNQDDSIYNPEKGIELLSDILDAGKYSPVLYEAFYKWRTQTQAFWHGMSNTSEIPNGEYNEKRWSVIQTVKQYVKNNPDDIWAKTQVNLLMSLPDIERGGPMGNSNLNHWGALYQGK